jgi:hypothetical protein
VTTVRGKKPLEAGHVHEVVGESYGQQVVMLVEGYNPRFTTKVTLSTHQTRQLIRSLRRELRRVRDETVARLNADVEQAEGPL